MVRSLGALELIAILAGGLIASAMLLTGLVQGSSILVLSLLGLAAVVWTAIRDIRNFIIPDGAVISLALAGALARLGVSNSLPADLGILFLDAAVCGGAFLVIREAFFRLRGFDGMGFGDVKLAVACGVLVGYEGFAWSVFAASALGLLVAVVWTIARPDKPITRLPFGALLAPACWCVWVVQLSGAI
jgi:leader peptidase (prepilin peptidase)/N-methyltransferase